MAETTIDENTTPGDLRKAYEKALERAAAAEKRADGLAAKDRSTTVAELLKAKGVEGAAKAAGVYPSDKAADEASVVAWIEENKDFLKITSPTTTSTTDAGNAVVTPGTPAGATQPDINALAAQLVAMATATGGQDDSSSNIAGAPTIDGDRVNQMMAALRNTPRSAEGYKQLADMGIFPQNPGSL